MKWEEVKNLIERSVPEQLLNDYLIAVSYTHLTLPTNSLV